MQTYLAHIAPDGRQQTVQEHLEGTAELCARFAAAFGAEEQGRLIGMAHDIGKTSKEFQARLQGGPIVDHTTAGTVECAMQDLLWAAHCVAGHHGGLLDEGTFEDQAGDATLLGRVKKGIAGRIPSYSKNVPLEAVSQPALWGKEPLTDAFFIRMMYSCLVDADYLDTEQFMKGKTRARGHYDPLPVLMDRLEQYIAPWWAPKTELNRKRCDILRTCIEKGDEPKGLYTLTVPTGGGKTVASLAFALRHAVHHGMARVIYVIPYTSIIEQNAAVFREILGQENVVEHHSGVQYDPDGDLDLEGYRQALATENWDAPVIVTTAVQFFESLYAARPSKCRKLHNLVNSVIIFDEAQMIPTGHLRPCVAGIAQLVEHYGATAVLCTATQPSLGDLFREYANGRESRELCPGIQKAYDQFRRVSFVRGGKKTWEEVAGELADRTQVLCIVNSRKAAQEIYEKLPGEGSFHLSTLMYPDHRRKVLEKIRGRLREGLPCRVVSTSLIEAGVDIDFPVVYREMAGLDSILQAAGRCNREGKRKPEDSLVVIFEGEGTIPPLLEVNIGATQEALTNVADPGSPEAIAAYFTSYRSLAEKKLDKANVIAAFTEENNPFRTVAERFHLIDDLTKTVYIPEGEGAELAERLLAGERSRSLYRKAGRYGVTVYGPHYAELLEAGDILPLDEESAVLHHSALYQETTGLSLTAEWGKAYMV